MQTRQDAYVLRMRTSVISEGLRPSVNMQWDLSEVLLGADSSHMSKVDLFMHVQGGYVYACAGWMYLRMCRVDTFMHVQSGYFCVQFRILRALVIYNYPAINSNNPKFPKV